MVNKLMYLGLSIKRLQHHHHAKADKMLSVLKVSLVQWDTLRHIDQNPESSMHALAQLTFQSDQSFGTLTARMIKSELIESRAGSGRIIYLCLTDHGNAILNEGEVMMEQILHETFGALNDKQVYELNNLLHIVLTSNKISN